MPVGQPPYYSAAWEEVPFQGFRPGTVKERIQHIRNVIRTEIDEACPFVTSETWQSFTFIIEKQERTTVVKATRLGPTKADVEAAVRYIRLHQQELRRDAFCKRDKVQGGTLTPEFGTRTPTFGSLTPASASFMRNRLQRATLKAGSSAV